VRGEHCWLRTGLSCPWGAVGDPWIMLARLAVPGCATAGGSWAGVPVGLRVLRGRLSPNWTPKVLLRYPSKICFPYNMDASLWVVCAALVVVAAIRRRIAALAEPKRTAEFLKGKRVMITVRAVPRRRPHCIWYSVARARRVPAVVSGGRWP
jgi:hypothetical protein